MVCPECAWHFYLPARERIRQLLDPDSFDAYKTLGTIFHLAGMALNARRALERAAELDPSDHMVENLLRELRK